MTRRTIVMDRAVPDPSLYPADSLREALRELVDAPADDLFSYGPSEGDEVLRTRLEQRLAARGIDVEQNELLIVGGSQQGIDLVARLLLRGGGVVALDAPTYRGALEVFRLNGAETVGLPLTPLGTDLEALEDLLRRRRVRLIYVMPSLHNPSGITLGAPARRRLYDLARRARVPILEDDWLADLAGPEDPPPLKAMDDAGLVIHSGTFSKTAVPGFRVGWLMVPRELFPALLDLKSHCDLSTGLVGQKALARFLDGDLYDQHVTRVRAQYEKRLRHGLRALNRHMPEGTTWTSPAGGMVNWLRIPEGIDGVDVARAAATRDVLVSPGELYLSSRQGSSGLRLCYSLCTPTRIEKGIERLAEALREVMGRNPRGVRAQTAPPV